MANALEDFATELNTLNVRALHAIDKLEEWYPGIASEDQFQRNYSFFRSGLKSVLIGTAVSAVVRMAASDGPFVAYELALLDDDDKMHIARQVAERFGVDGF